MADWTEMRLKVVNVLAIYVKFKLQTLREHNLDILDLL